MGKRAPSPLPGDRAPKEVQHPLPQNLERAFAQREETAAGAALRSELAACLTPLLQRLSDEHREALQPTEFEGLSQVCARCDERPVAIA
jgi:DNA-directed RNA polymerase specialized sigma24 family protein